MGEHQSTGEASAPAMVSHQIIAGILVTARYAVLKQAGLPKKF